MPSLRGMEAQGSLRPRRLGLRSGRTVEASSGQHYARGASCLRAAHPLASAAMTIALDATVNVPKPPTDCFAYLDDFANTPRWNPRCVEVRQTSPGPRAVGSALH